MDHSVIVWEPGVRWSACGCLSNRMSHGSQGNWGHFYIECLATYNFSLFLGHFPSSLSSSSPSINSSNLSSAS